MFGPDRLLSDLQGMGYEVERVTDVHGMVYVVIRDFEVSLGPFSGRIIDLALLPPPDYPRNVGSSVHVRAAPQLLECHNTIPGRRNILISPLGAEWRYWSRNFGWGAGEKTTRRLISQINEVFANA